MQYYMARLGRGYKNINSKHAMNEAKWRKISKANLKCEWT